MNILAYNFGWMVFNIVLAIIPILAGQVMLVNKNTAVKITAGFIWLIFLPNTIYLLTDFTHFFEDISSLSGTLLLVDLIMYFALIFLGIFTFVVSVIPFEKLFFRSGKKIKRNMPVLLALNLLIGFGVVLGRVQRTNSWEIFTNIQKVISDTISTVFSLDLLLLAVGFGIMCHLLYLAFSSAINKQIEGK